MDYLKKITTIALLLLPLVGVANAPKNLDRVRQGLKKYHDSGRYYRAINVQTQRAMHYLQLRLARNKSLRHPKKLAVVFDIDETALSNYPDMRRMQFGGTPRAINRAEDLGHDPAIPGTLRLYRFAKKRGLAIFFVTGRREYQRAATIKNLRAVGYTHWQGLYLKPNNYRLHSAIPYKKATRRSIEKQGYDIALNIGDQWSDLRGGYADRNFKLPDPYYTIP